MALSEEKIQEILLSQDYISKEDLEEAKEQAKSLGGSFLDYLFLEGVINKEIYGEAIAEYYGVPYAYFGTVKLDKEIVTSIPEIIADKNRVIPFSITKEGVKVGMQEPDNLEIRQILEKKFGHKILPFFITEEDFERAFTLYSKDIQEKFTEILEKLSTRATAREERDNLVVEIVETILAYGYENKSSDIHIEPYEKKITVRYRIDGVMHDILTLPKELADSVLTRIKILAKMRTDVHRAAQDGKFRYKTKAEQIDIRVSILPVTHGENVVMRLLVSDNQTIALTDLGLSSKNLKIVKNAIKNPHGMILVTGPTGSGKTTSLYAVLRILNRREVKIATIEDPVEYDVAGITQIQVNNKTDLTFARGLRAIVRQDPDIIMVGEIRDEETADIAVNAALTGHLVLSTLHTNDAVTTLPRLLDMNVEPFLVSSTINIVIAQRLVRKICLNCRISTSLSDEKIANIKQNEALTGFLKQAGYKDLKKLRIYKGQGCEVCSGTHYKGRIGIFEVLDVSEKIKKMIGKGVPSSEIKEVAIKEGMKTLLQDGVEKVLNGITTIDEILRVVEE